MAGKKTTTKKPQTTLRKQSTKHCTPQSIYMCQIVEPRVKLDKEKNSACPQLYLKLNENILTVKNHVVLLSFQFSPLNKGFRQ